MEDHRFDQLSRRLAGFGSRRQAIKALATAVVASVASAAGVRATIAPCTATYRPCQSDGQCCAGAVCQSGICQPGCRIDGVFRSASTPQPGNTCAKCDPAKSTSAWSPANPGMACWSGSLCGGASTCQNGTCQPTNPTVCQPLTPCHLAGECNPNTGLCSHPPADAGTPCGGSETCIGGIQTPGLSCNGAGACTGGAAVPCTPYVCGDIACLTACSDDSHCAPGHTCCAGACTGESTAPCAPYACEPDACLTACSDDSHCAPGHLCCNGVCLTAAEFAAIDFENDINHCGACGNACEQRDCFETRCSLSACHYLYLDGVCANGTGTCDPSTGTCCPGGTSINFNSNVDHCGACGNVCVPENPCRRPECRNGVCGDALSQYVAYGVPCSGLTWEGVCDGLGTCLPICFPVSPGGPPSCTSDASCPDGEICLHGGCFSPCTGVGTACTTGCEDSQSTCSCHQPVGGRPLVCTHNSPPGFTCANDNDCAQWQICDESLPSGNDLRPYFCSLPCPVPFTYEFPQVV